MDTIQVQPTPAPKTPLNLQFGVVYAPRVATPPFVAFEAVELGPGEFVIRAYDEGGRVQTMRHGNISETWHRLALHLRMDVAP
jgi:hypothetical protein